MAEDKIKALDEYCGDDDKVPQWRIDKNIGKPIQLIRICYAVFNC